MYRACDNTKAVNGINVVELTQEDQEGRQQALEPKTIIALDHRGEKGFC